MDYAFHSPLPGLLIADNGRTAPKPGRSLWGFVQRIPDSYRGRVCPGWDVSIGITFDRGLSVTDLGWNPASGSWELKFRERQEGGNSELGWSRLAGIFFR